MLKSKDQFISDYKTKIKSTTTESLFSFFYQIYLNIFEYIALRINRIKFSHYKNIQNPLVTVITPTFNRADILLERAVKTCKEQTYQNIEHIIIGDGCTDDTEKKIKDLNYVNIKFYNIEKKISYKKKIENVWFSGPVRALNFGLKKSKGIWIARLDDDDIWEKDHIEKSLKFCQKNNKEFLTSGSISFSNGVKKDVKPYLINNMICGASNTFFFISYLKFFKFNINCWMKKKHRVNDVDLFDRMSKVGVRTDYRSEVSLKIYPRPGETTTGLTQVLLEKETYEKKYFSN